MKFNQLKRREFITLARRRGGGVAARGTRQQQAKTPRIGFLGLAPEFSGVEALRAGLRDLVDIEGTNIVIEWRWAEKVDQLPELAAELVRMNVNVIVAPSSTFVEAADRRPRRFPSCSQSMPILWASDT